VDVKDYKKTINNQMSEADLQTMVIKVAKVYDWKVSHFRGVRVQRANGGFYYQTPVQADGAGFPDLVLVRPPRLIFMELKSEKGKLSDAQQIWIDLLKKCYFKGIVSPVEVYVFKPSQWDEIEIVLK
jgi:hypothetical protein